jgi:hypothetical protein
MLTPQNTHSEATGEEAKPPVAAEPPRPDAPGPSLLRSDALELARRLAWLPNIRSSRIASERLRAIALRIYPMLAKLGTKLPASGVSDDFRWLHDNVRLVGTELGGLAELMAPLKVVPHVRTPEGEVVPRPIAVAAGFLDSTGYQFSDSSFQQYVEAFQQTTVLKVKELWGLVPALKLVLLDQIAERGEVLLADPSASSDVSTCMRSLIEITQNSWKDAVEPLICFDQVLRQDPAGAYPLMDFESRELCRKKIVVMAANSDLTEMEIALEALALAREALGEAHEDPRMRARVSHVGYYLLAEGERALQQRVGYKMPLGARVQSLLRKYPDEFYVPGIAVLTFAVMSAIVLLMTDPTNSPAMILLTMLALLLPSSQSAVEIMNYLTTSLLRAQILPKLDFSGAIPDDCLTLVAIPTLLLSEKQVYRLVDDLEVRFLGNHDPNLHFALVSDLPDSPEPAPEEHALIDLCAELIGKLNQKYAGENLGSFLFLHRHRVYNPHEGVWMGWERKRGKLLDLNKLLRNQYDRFPVKTGDLSLLPRVRYVITLDSDTELPRGSAQQMVGCLAHPLNTAILDAESNIVVAGYGILQPRVGISVQSAAQSRLANIYSGQTGFDIYTRAVSDIYQDLFGEGSFAGKGIYEVDTLHQVLERRFPRNALLSHDLIEGAYARAGLASDIEVIEDYPSHYNAYNKRKHRWLRGDWQITGWLLPRVPDQSGALVRNPISTISQWKILDNLRRSLVEPATCLLLILGWFALPGRPRDWTLATVIILFLPAWCRCLFELVRAAFEKKREIARDAVSALFTANVSVLLTLTFLAHQMLLSLDAVVRALVRRLVTGRRLLEWETAAEAELGSGQRTPLDIYLDWMPVLSAGLGVLAFFVRRSALWAALPVLALWACSKTVSQWLNRPPSPLHHRASPRDVVFLRKVALETWRYFAEFSTAEHHWLIPDNVQEDPLVIAARVSPTNLGLLLNARQVACQFGYLTVPEFATQTLATLETISKLKRHRGHLLNWYNTATLEPLSPAFVSSVDSGNLLAALWTLEQGCRERLRRPLLEPSLAQGIVDHLRLLVDLRALPRRQFSLIETRMTRASWLQQLIKLAGAGLPLDPSSYQHPSPQLDWLAEQTRRRLDQVRDTARAHTPWQLTQFSALQNDTALNLASLWTTVTLERIPEFIDALTLRLQLACQRPLAPDNQVALYRELLSFLPSARAHAVRLIEGLETILSSVRTLSREMDFSFLLNQRRKLLSVGFDVDRRELNAACYDLLASEARIASFVAIAKDDIPQESWFKLGRAHILHNGRPLLLSWTGTMFEYLMPSIWMRSFPDTLLDRSRHEAVRAQQAHTAQKRIPWGISESAHFATDAKGNYQYYAFGLAGLAIHKPEIDSLVISPYSTCLALDVDATAALRNLHRMARDGWLGPYGFYEAADFTAHGRRGWRTRHDLVRCWMAHHQGMSLLSIANFLDNEIVQSWFHSDPRVQATELLLHEKPLAHVRVIGSTRTAR